MKTLASCRKLTKKQTCKRKVNRKSESFPGPIKLSETRTIRLDIYNSEEMIIAVKAIYAIA